MRGRLPAAFLYLCIFLLGLIGLHASLARPALVRLDCTLPQAIHERATPFETIAAKAISLLGSPRTLDLAVPVAAIILWSRRLRREAVFLAGSLAGAGLLESLIKLAFRRPRPTVPWIYVHERGFSFPSGHAVLNLVLYGAVAYLLLPHLPRLWQRLAVIAACLSLVAAIGLSRIYLGAHYPTDVASGFLIGAAWLFAAVFTDRALTAPN